MNLNTRIFLLIHSLNGKYKAVDYLMFFASEVVIYLTFTVLLLLAFFKRGIYLKSFLLSALSTPLALIIILLIHLFIKEKRPFIRFRFKPLVSFYTNLSFPSTHTTLMTLMALPQIYYQTGAAVFVLIPLVWVALARVYIGVHYPLDILGGFLTGISSLIITLGLIIFLGQSF